MKKRLSLLDDRMTCLREERCPVGFTMLELIIVMGIIAMVAAVSVPRLGKAIAHMKLRSAVRTCSAVLRYAKSVAITTQQEQKVGFNLMGNPEGRDSYTYDKVSPKPEEGENAESLNTSQEDAGKGPELVRERRKKELDAEISMSWRNNKEGDWQDEGAYEITFSPRGFASGGEIRFALTDARRAYILGVDPVTGRVLISAAEE